MSKSNKETVTPETQSESDALSQLMGDGEGVQGAVPGENLNAAIKRQQEADKAAAELLRQEVEIQAKREADEAAQNPPVVEEPEPLTEELLIHPWLHSLVPVKGSLVKLFLQQGYKRPVQDA